MIIAAVYSPSRHSISVEEYNQFLSQMGTHYQVAGDWDAKNIAWESHLTTVKGRNLLQVIQQNNLSYLSTSEPTDANKIPDLLDFVITNGISDLYTTIESNLELESDHSAVTVTISVNIIRKETPPRPCNKHTEPGTISNIYQ
jgi:hypothetical protein